MPFTIRPATPTDHAALLELLRSTFEDTWRPHLSDAAIRAYRDSDRVSRFIAEAGSDILLAESAGRLLGMVHWEEDFVDALHVAAEARRQGVARALMQRTEAAMRAAGFAQSRLETDSFNTASQALYRALGYEEKGRYPDEEWNSGLTTVLFVKNLPAG